MRKTVNAVFCTAVLALLLGSCKKETPLDVTGSPLGDAMPLEQTDTISLFTETIREHSLINGKVLSGALLGATNDPFFGITKSTFYSDFDLQENNLSFGPAPSLDSVVLSIAFKNDHPPYGNTGSAVIWRVYELEQGPLDGDAFFSDKEFARKPTEIGNYSGAINRLDSVSLTLDGQTKNYQPHVRIRLNNTFGSKLLNAPSGTYNDKYTFRNFMKGLVVIPDNPSEGAIFKMDPYGQMSKITVFYNNGQRKEFPIGENGNWFNNYGHEYNTSLLKDRYDKGFNADTCFIQSMAGVKMKIQVPGLRWMAEQNLAINEAQLILPVLPGSFGTYTPVPQRLLLVKRGNDGRNDFLLDQLYEADKYGGYYNSADQTYTFSLVRHLQDIIKKYKRTGQLETPDLYVIIPSDNPLTASRLMIDSRKNNKLRLKVTYTKIQ